MIKDIVVNPGVLKLYRFRSINKITKEQLKNDDFYSTSPVAFNDPYDSLVIFDKNKIINKIESNVMRNKPLLSKIGIDFDAFTNERISNEIYNFIIKPSQNVFNDNLAVACLSEKINQEIMWAHYADSSKGFALEYDLNDLLFISEKYYLNIIKNLFEIEPSQNKLFNRVVNNLTKVHYSNKKFDATDYYIKYVDALFDSLKQKGVYNENDLMIDSLIKLVGREYIIDLIKNTLSYKKIEWKYESEWRFVFPKIGSPNNLYLCVGKVKPKAIYLGERISNYQKKKILEIVGGKKIPVFQMYSEMCDKTISLFSKKIA